MSVRNIIGFILIIASLVCLYPGLVKPIMNIKVGMEVPILGEISLHDTTQSIIGTIETLYENNNRLVAFLILLFSVLVPIIKAILLLIALFSKGTMQNRLYNFVHAIGKWSMADVFVVGVFLAFLATQSDDGIHAELHNGFYYFLAYCIISLLAIQFIDLKPKVDETMI